jgi:hypothetical protein
MVELNHLSATLLVLATVPRNRFHRNYRYRARGKTIVREDASASYYAHVGFLQSLLKPSWSTAILAT